jgi:hypothetical protein
MYIPTEIIILFFLISFLIYTMPIVLIKFSKTLKGKTLLLILTMVITLYNRLAGLIMTMFYIFLAEINYEFNNGIIYEGFTDKIDLNNFLLHKEKKKDQLAIQEALTPINSANQKIARKENKL